jgi:dienelactone hydrolase
MLRFQLICVCLMAFWNAGFGQQTVTFQSTDGVEVTADLYVSSTQNPYIILLHQAGYSRGEYREIAPKLVNLGFNCLAVDLRSGYEVNFIKNQTHIDAKSKNLSTKYIDSRPDIKAAINFIASRTNKPIVLFGSSYSAALALIEATENFKVKAVVVFSPGEYFDNPKLIKESTQKLFVPVLALSSKPEFSEMEVLLNHIPKKHLSLFAPSTGQGVHGAKALWDNNNTCSEYWMAITQFFSQLKIK